MVTDGAIQNGEKINICVPTGNFGNIFAAYVAKKMGLPVNRLICASNKNNILTDFLATGTYDRNRHFYTTMSPSMDILISSNLERLLYLLGGSKKTSAYMKQLSECGTYTISPEMKKAIGEEFTGFFCDEENTQQTIQNTFQAYHYVCDTHTAVGVSCANQYLDSKQDAYKMLVVSTASPYKFASDVYTSLTGEPIESGFTALAALESYTKLEIPSSLAALEKKEIRFQTVAEKEDMIQQVYQKLQIV